MPCYTFQKERLFFENRNLHGDVVDGTIAWLSADKLNLIDHIEALLYLTEDGVVLIEEGCATNGGIDLTLLGSVLGFPLLLGQGHSLFLQFVLQGHQACVVAVLAQLDDATAVLDHEVIKDVLQLLLRHLTLELGEFAGTVDLASDDVELATTGTLLGIDLVALTGSSEGSLLVYQRLVELGRDGVVGASGTEMCCGRSSTRIGIATLNHKVLDDTVEESAVVIALTGQLEEIITMKGGLVIKTNGDVTEGGLDQDFGHGLFFGGKRMKSSHTRLLTGTKGEQGGQGWLRQGRLAAIDGCDKDKRGRRGSHKWLLTRTKGTRGTERG